MRITILLFISLFILSCSVKPKPNTSTKVTADRPNIVLLMADDMGYECLSANGSVAYQTPVLDQLGNEGIRFYSG